MSAPTISTGRTWIDGETVTPSRVNETVNSATLNFTATDMLAGRSTSGAGAAEEIACTAAGRALLDDANAAAQRTTLGLGTIATQAANAVAVTGGAVALDHYAAINSTLTYGASVALDFSSTAKTCQTVTLTGDITFTTSNLAAGRAKLIRIVGDSSSRALTFPAGWKFMGASRPTGIAANKTAELFVNSWSTTDASVTAHYTVEP